MKNLILISIIMTGAFLRLDRLGELMAFIGDQGWFYLSARDMILTGNVPLVGITSSHTWLHQGPIWTYMLVFTLWISNFNPVSGSILTAIIGIAAIFLIYKLGADFFSKKFGLVAALIYATSPFIIIHERLAYHTSPIPFLVLLLIYSLLKVTKGKSIFFPIVALCISLLYNFELATVVFIPIVLFFMGFGFYKKEKWGELIDGFRVNERSTGSRAERDSGEVVKNQKIIILSALALIVPMTPILIYDFQNGFPQTIKFGAWFAYKGVQFVGLIEKPMTEPFLAIVKFFIEKMSLLIFAPNTFISIAILLLALGFCAISIKRKEKILSPLTLIFSLTAVGILGFFAAGAKSEAYLPMLFPGVVLLISFLVLSLFEINRYVILIVIIVSLLNAIFIFRNNYLVDKSPGYGPSLAKRIDAVKKIMNRTNGQRYNIEGRGGGSEFESFTMNYEYLLWWRGSPPSQEKQDLVLVIEEKDVISISSYKRSQAERQQY